MGSARFCTVAKPLGTLVVFVVVATVFFVNGADARHERKEVAGLTVVFGAEPEPALTGELQYLRWRIQTLADLLNEARDEYVRSLPTGSGSRSSTLPDPAKSAP